MDKATKFRHNKKRNVLFLYEALVRSLTKAILTEDHAAKERILTILKECFHQGTLLHDEMTLYRTLQETSGLSRKAAERLLSEVLRVYSNFNQGELTRQQDALVAKINKDAPKRLYSVFVPSYKNLATIYQLFKNKKLSLKSKVLLEERIIESLMESGPAAKEEERPEGIGSLAFRMFVKSFNEQCSGLLSEQKQLLQKFISSSSDLVEFRAFLNEEIGRIRSAIPKLLLVKEIAEDPVMLERAGKISSVLDQFREEREITVPMLETLLHVQQLISEGLS